MVSARKRERKKIFAGKKKVKQRARNSFLLTSADSALVVGCSLVRRGCRAARVHRFVSPFAHLSFSFSCGLFVRLMTIEFVLFPSFLEVERSEKKGPIFLYVFYVNYARQNVYNNNIHLL